MVQNGQKCGFWRSIAVSWRHLGEKSLRISLKDPPDYLEQPLFLLQVAQQKSALFARKGLYYNKYFENIEHQKLEQII